MKWRCRLPLLAPTTVPAPTPVDRYKIVVTYPDGATFALGIGGPWTYDPPGHNPAHLAECIADGLRRGGYDVKLQEERTVIT